MKELVYNKNLVKSLHEARRNALESFSGIEHRLEEVAVLNGVQFINDSKATDLPAVLHSLELIDKPITLILGTSEYDEDYSVLLKQTKYKVISLVVFGKRSDEKIRQTLGVFSDKYVFVENIDEAFQYAVQFTNKGETLLFSPACTSFDYFATYKERGDYFRNYISSLKN